MKRTSLPLLGLLLALGLPAPIRAEAPAATAVESVAPTDPDRAFQAGVELYRAGRLPQARRNFQEFLYRFPDSLWLDRVQLYLARIAFAEGDYPRTLQILEQIPAQQRDAEARYLEGLALVESGRPQAGLALLLPLQQAPFFPEDRIRLFVGLSRGEAALERTLPALYFLEQARRLGGEEGELLAEAHALLTRLSSEQLAEATFLFAGSAVGQDARVQLAGRLLDAGQRHQARALIDSVILEGTPFPYRGDVARLRDRLEGGAWLQRDALGVLLPLSGRYASFGRLARRGVELAARQRPPGAPPVRLLFRDSAADPNQAAKAVSELANSERVIAILGPLVSSAAGAAAERAQAEAVPLLTLAPRDDLPALGDYVFRNSLTARQQARTLAEYAADRRGISAFGVLRPATRQGEELARLFREEVARRGGLVVVETVYPETATDFRAQILPLRGRNPKAPDEAFETEAARERERALEALWRPAIFDALFIPDDAERVALILPQLAFHGLERVLLLGSNGWNTPELVKQAGRFGEGAVFVDGFFPHSPYPFVREFVDAYFEAYGEEPTFIEAQAFDAANLLFAALERQPQSREDLRRQLLTVRNYPGVTGATSFNLQGEADKTLYLLTISHGNISQLD